METLYIGALLGIFVTNLWRVAVVPAFKRSRDGSRSTRPRLPR